MVKKRCNAKKVRPVQIKVKGHMISGKLHPGGKVTLTPRGRKTYNRLKKRCLAKKRKGVTARARINKKLGIWSF